MKTTKTQDAVIRDLYEHEGDHGFEAVARRTGLSRRDVIRSLNELEEMGMVSGPADTLIKTSRKALVDMESGIGPTDSGYHEHLILVASLLSQANEQFLAEHLMLDDEFVAVVGARLRAARAWLGESVNPEFSNKILNENDGATFYALGAIATGDLKVVGGTDYDPLFQMTDQGLAKVERLKNR